MRPLLHVGHHWQPQGAHVTTRACDPALAPQTLAAQSVLAVCGLRFTPGITGKAVPFAGCCARATTTA